MQHRQRNGSTGLGRTSGARLCRLHDERSIQPEGTARHRMASDLVGLRRHRRTGQQEVHELGPRKTKRGIKMSRRGIKSEPPEHEIRRKEPHGAVNWYREGSIGDGRGINLRHTYSLP